MTTPRPVRVRGPLAPWAQGFGEHLAGEGFRSGADHLYLMAQLSRWMDGAGLEVGSLSATVIDDFAAWRAAQGFVSPVSAYRVSLLIDYLIGVGVLSEGEAALPAGSTEALVERYKCYLIGQRGFGADSVRAYLDAARLFLAWLGAEGVVDLEDVTAGEVTRFVVEEVRRLKVASAKAMTTRLRSLLRFLYVEGLVVAPLADAVPSVAGWRLATLPKALPPAQVTALLGSCDRRSAIGRRDFAIFVVLSRLGLRAGEAARLGLSDIDWRSGELTVRGKGNRVDRLPLPLDVGEAIAAWLSRGRPICQDRSLFVRVRAPHRALTSGGVSSIVWRACGRAGLDPARAHRLRHSAATGMLAGGASLGEIGQVLRHQRSDTTALYAKVDRKSLMAVVRPWPGVTR
jgi:integrase/recombinase XerD